MISLETLAVLAVPGTDEPLRPEQEDRENGALVGVLSGRRFPVRVGIPEIVQDEGLHRPNRRYERLYDRIASVRNCQYAIWSGLLRGGEARVREMARVAKPGAKVLIVDATERLSRAYEKISIARRLVQERGTAMAPPVEAVPLDMPDVRLSEVCRGDVYCMTFRRPK